jgi:hypothetical protein
MRSRTTWAGVALLLFVAGAALASDQEDVTKQPGYVDFDIMKLFSNEPPELEIYIDTPLMNMVAAAMRTSDPELSNMLAKLKQIRVQSFKIDSDKLQQIEQKTSEVSKRLEHDGWQTIVRVRQPQKRSQVYVYMKYLNNVVQGLAVMSVDPEEEASFVKASFLNIVGEIDPAQIDRLQHHFDIHGLDSLDIQMRGLHRDRDREPEKKK